MPTRLQLRGETLEGLEWRVFNEYPQGSRIVAAEKVTEGGIAGFLARHFYEVTVEVPDAPVIAGSVEEAAPSRHSASHPVPLRSGVAALLADADDAEAAMHATKVPAAVPAVSTTSRVFDELLEALAATSRDESPGEAGRAVPEPLDGPGDVVLVIGLANDALATARSMAAATTRSVVKTAGSLRVNGIEHIVSRQSLTSVRAAGVIAGEPVFVAFGLGPDGSLQAAALTDLPADQVWVVVDATRKSTDTSVWVRKAGWSTTIHALAVVGSQDTLSPHTVNDLDLPIGWVDGRKATRPVL